MIKSFAIALMVACLLPLCGCWQVAAARAAKKRTTQTGIVAGTVENELGVDDPLGRRQKIIKLSDGENETQNRESHESEAQKQERNNDLGRF